ncbi:putative bicyclomycin resistance protein [Zopfia rhizophila CBS 207.26]|uniref:Putative bicyclomycin resistance protein n=1 Tax=Zopfia rhizophila CBS 207.26 TaxID=1314779 RepID=A0A6A6D9D1_9PEZI|nr:putative bicyclomycin resistance protein [Zopfia rhizophila CBS 207.26]
MLREIRIPSSIATCDDSSNDLEKEGKTQSHNEADTASIHAAAQDWNGPNDPLNPHNWSRWLRIYHTIPPALFGFAVLHPAVSDVMSIFHVSRTAALIPLTVYMLGLGFGPVISAPISETHGRKIVYIISFPIFMLFTLGAGFSRNFRSLVVCRFFAGSFGSPIFGGRWALATSMFLMAPFLGPSLGPFIGGFAAQYKGWRWTQWCMLFISVPVYLMSIPTKETYKKIILKRRAKKLGIAPPKTTTGTAAVKSIIIMNFLRPLHMLFTEPVVFFLSLYSAFAFAVLFLFFTVFPFVFQGPPYSFTTSQVGLTFLAIGLGVGMAGITGIVIDRTVYQRHHREALGAGYAYAQPEHRLYSAMIGSFGIPVGLFWFAWTADKGVGWGTPVVAAIPFAWGNLCLFITTALYMVDVYGPLNGASAIAANGIFRYTLGAVFPLFTVQMYETLGTGWTTSLLGFLSVLMLRIPWVLYKWGPAIRKRSRYPVMM